MFLFTHISLLEFKRVGVDSSASGRNQRSFSVGGDACRPCASSQSDILYHVTDGEDAYPNEVGGARLEERD